MIKNLYNSYIGAATLMEGLVPFQAQSPTQDRFSAA
jgi:hypothetical protein